MTARFNNLDKAVEYFVTHVVGRAKAQGRRVEDLTSVGDDGEVIARILLGETRYGFARKNAPGIDLIDSVSGTGVQVKTTAKGHDAHRYAFSTDITVDHVFVTMTSKGFHASFVSGVDFHKVSNTRKNGTYGRADLVEALAIETNSHVSYVMEK